MKSYKDTNKDSGILAYEYDDNSISIQFKKGGIYTYSVSKIGSVHLEQMKFLADSANGLNSYINKYPEIKKGFS